MLFRGTDVIPEDGRKGVLRSVLWALAGFLSALAAVSIIYPGTADVAFSGRAAAFTLLLAAVLLAVAGLAVISYTGRVSALVSKALDRLSGGDYEARITCYPGWLRGVPESFERLARALEDRAKHDLASHEETALLRRQSVGLEERLTNANADLSKKETLLKEVNRELISANRAKTDFISRMGRELRLPLNTIMGLSDFMLRGGLGPLSEKQRDYIDKIRTRADNLLDLENNIVEYSMLDSLDPPRFREIGVREVAEEVASSLGPYARQMDVSVELDIAVETVKADINKLRYILYDLLHNAVKFNLPGGKTTLSAKAVEAERARDRLAMSGMDCPPEACPGFVEFVVEDTGIGIPTSRYGELFRPFSQIPDDMGRKPGGAGLSLFLVRKFVEQHGGCVWVEPGSRGGSRFRVLMPSTPSGESIPVFRKKKVMIVEDDLDQMNLVSAYLADAPYELIKVNNGLEALKVLDEVTPDIILLDVMLPGMDGIEVCWAVKRQENFKSLCRVPVIMTTSRTDMENKLNAIRAGADDVIFKPMDRRLLVERIKYLLEAREELENVMASYRDLEKEALVDPLTGLFNRRYMDDVIVREFMTSKRYGRNLSVLMMDIDNFKAYNDMFGHLAGDELLRKAASIFVDSVREVDIVARYGGEEFMVILPETPPDLAIVAAERIRNSVEKNTAVTLSIGQASFPDDAGELAELLRNADTALYRAKRTGRNRTVGFEDCRMPDTGA